MNKISTLFVAILIVVFSQNVKPQNNPASKLGNWSISYIDKPANSGVKERKVLTKLTPYNQIVEQTTFFKGDTLNGYDYTTALNSVISKYDLLIELKTYMFRDEVAFVKKKYNIDKLPFEIAASTNKTVSPPNTVNASACANSDFENNNTTNWNLYYGDINYVNLPCYTCATTAGSTSFMVNSTSSVGTQCSGGIDSYGNFPVVGSGSYSLLLNDDNAGGKIERASYKFVASGTNSLFTFKYAPVLQSGGHPLNEQPFFHVDVTDLTTGSTVPCTAYDISVPTSGAITGWSTSSVDNTVYYKGWTSAFVDVASISGHTVSVNLTVSDCNQGGHFGYTYLDANCGVAQISVANPAPCVGSTDVISVPPMSGASYAWAGPGLVGHTANTATVNASGVYTATVSIGSCYVVLTNTVTFVPNPTVTVSPSTYTTCLNSPVTFSASGATSYVWSPTTGMTGSTTANPVVTPTSTSTVVYTVTGTTSGCTNAKTVTLTVNPKPTVTVNSPTVCSGSSVNITAAGASTYTWNTGSTSNPLSVTPGATSYTVTGTSALGCTNTAVSTVTVVALPTVTVNSPTVCSGSSVNLTAAGASTYTWNTGSTSNPLSVTPGATSYTVTGTAATSCTNSAVSTVNIIAKPTVTVNSPTVCSGSSVSLTAAGASTYTWNTGSTSNPLSVTPGATSYTVTGTAATSCTNSAVSTVTVIAKPTVTVNSPTVCSGSSVNLTAAGALTYTWNTGSTANPLSVTPGATSYTVTATDVNTCTNTAVSTVTVVAKPTVTVNSPTVCSGSSVNLTAAGASTYTWNTGSTSNPLSVTPGATSYTVTGTAATSCTNSAVSTVTVVALPTVTVNSPTVCAGSSVNLTAAGASTYTWNTGSTSNPLSVTPGATSYTVTGTAATSCTNSAVSTVTVIAKPTVTVNSPTVCSGSSVSLTAAGASTYTWNTGSTSNPLSVTPGATSYTVTGTAATSCTNSAVSTVTVVAKPTLTLTPSPAAICAGASSVLTGTGASTYTWTAPAGGGLSATTGGSVTATPTVSSGTLTYTLTGTAATSCTNTTTGSLVVNPLPTYTLTGNAYTICNGGSQTFTVNAGTGSTYTWTPSATLTNPNTASPTASPTTTTVYSVVATNTLGCTNGTAATVTLNVTAIPSMSLTANSFTICNGASKTFTVSGASSYTWTPASTLTNANTANPTASPTTTTIYTVNGVASGCAPSPALTVTLTVNPLPTYSLSSNTYTICNGASQTFSVSGASTYTWTPSTSLSNANIANPTANPTTTTVYSVTGTNSNSCTNLIPATVTLTVNPLPSLTITPAPTATICSAASATLTASGANTYSWSSGAATSTVSVTGVNTGTTTTTNTISVVGTSTANCVSSQTYTLTVSPTPTISLSSPTYTICSGGNTTFSVNATGGTYSWTQPSNANINSGGTTATPNVTSTNTTAVATTPVFTVTASIGTCTSVAQTVTLTVNPLPVITVVPTSTAICSDGGSSTLTATGANTYTWTPAATLSASTGSVVTAVPTDTTVPTTYTVTGTDANSCVNSNTVSITVNQTPTVTVAGGGGNSQVVCGGGIINTSVNGITFSVTPAGSVSWTNDNTNIGLAASGNGNIATYPAPTVTAQTTGIITANAVAASGCASTTNSQLVYTVTINPTPSVTTPTINPAGCGLSDGTIVGASGTGGSGSYSYSWNGGPFVADSSLTDSAGTYPLQVKDNVTGCISTQNFTLPNAGAPAPPSVTPSTTVACAGDVVVLTAPTVAGVTYNWTEANGTTGTGDTYTVTNIPGSPNPYTIDVTATSSNCKGAATTTSITVNPLPTPAISNSTSQICNLTSTTLTVTPNAGGYSYQWGNLSGPIAGATADTLVVSSADVYSVTVTNTVTGCQATASANGTITVNALPIIDTTNVSITQSNCSVPTGGISNVTYTVNGSGTYVWTDNSTGNVVGTNSPTLSNVPAGNYCVQVTDINSCVQKFCYISVTNSGAPVQPVLTASVNDTVYCNGDPIQTLTVSVTNSGTITPTVNWYGDAALTNTLSINSNTYTPSASLPVGTTTLYVTATANGCTSLSQPVTVTILPTPTISIAPLGSNSVICNGSSVVITPSGANTYTLNPGNQTGTSFTVSPTTGTTTYTINGSNTVTGCSNAQSNQGTASITVNPTPTISIVPLGSNSVICNGSSVVITPTGATTYTLNPGNQTGTSFTVNPATGTTTYTINGTDGTTTCTNASSDIGLATITVNATPTISIVPLGSNSVICNGSSVVITPTGATTYTLNPGNQTGTSFTVNPGTGTTTYTINGTDGTTTCTNASSDIGLATITVNATPTISIVPLGSNSVICNGASVVITPSGAITYTLNPGNQTGTSFTVSPTSSTTYTIDGSNGSSNCVNSSSDAALAGITVNPTPTVNISGVSLDSAKCGLATGGVTGISVVGGAPSYTYQWYDANGAIAGATSITLSNVSTGNYSLQVTDANGCVAGGAGSVTTFSVPASTAVHAQFNTNPSPAVGTVPLVVTFNNTSNGASSYIWSFGDAANTYTTSTNASYTYNSVGSYTATLVAINGACADTARVVILAEIPTTITVPNIFSPNGDGVNDQFFIINTGMKSMNCDIFNRWGQLLWTLTAPDQTWDGSLINGDKAPEGTYMYILEANGLDGKTYKQQGTVTLVR